MGRKIAFIFSGQGSQYVGMGKELTAEFPEAAEIFSLANNVLGFDLQNLCFHGPAEDLNLTQNTQPAIYTVSFIIKNILLNEGIIPTTVAGHSLGEYSALASAGVFSFEEGLDLVRKRGLYMNEALPAGLGTMAAIIGLDSANLKKICEKVDGVCEIANYNTPQQTVISGEKKAVQNAMQKAEEAGAKKVIELKVSGPFHSSLMKPARNKLADEIKKLSFNAPEYKFIANATANYVEDPAEIKNALVDQLTSSVRWVETIQLMIDDGIDIFVEVGPGRVLKGMMRRIDRSVDAFNVENMKSLRKTLNKVKDLLAV